MKIVDIQHVDLVDCIQNARRQRIVVARKGKPVAVIIGVKGMDWEQVELGSSDKFWKLVRKWRKQPTMSRAELERRLEESDRQKNAKPRKKK